MKVVLPASTQVIRTISDAINESVKLYGLKDGWTIATLVEQRLSEQYVILKGVEK